MGLNEHRFVKEIYETHGEFKDAASDLRVIGTRL